jgi:hypothetical protein
VGSFADNSSYLFGNIHNYTGYIQRNVLTRSLIKKTCYNAPLLAEGLPFMVESHRFSLRNRKRQRNRLEYLEAMHLIALADEVVMTPEVVF